MRVREDVDLPGASGMNDVTEPAAQADERARVLNGIEQLRYRNLERQRPGYRILITMHDRCDDISCDTWRSAVCSQNDHGTGTTLLAYGDISTARPRGISLAHDGSAWLACASTSRLGACG